MLTNDEIVETTINEMKNYDFDKFKFLRENNVIKIYPDESYRNLVDKLNIYLDNKYILDECYIFEFDNYANIMRKPANIHSYFRFNINILPNLIKIILKHEEYILFVCDVYPTFREIANGNYPYDINVEFDKQNQCVLLSRNNINLDDCKSLLTS